MIQKGMNVFSNISSLSGGAIAAVAAKAAASSLLLRISYESIEFHTDDGRPVNVPVRFIPHPENHALREFCVVLGNVNIQGLSGASEVHVTVERVRKMTDIPDDIYIKPEYINLYLDGGEGISRLTAVERGVPAGFANIDKEARDVIFEAVADAIHFADIMPLIKITVSAISYNNSSLQFSITGGNGSVARTSQDDVLSEIAGTIQEQYESGIRNVIAVPGNAGHKYIQDNTHISMAHCIRCRNYIGDTLDMAAMVGMENFLLVGNASKLIRLAAGIMDTHTWNADGRREVFSLHTVLAGGTISQARILQDLATTDQMLAKLTEWGIRDAVMQSICVKIGDYVQNRIGGKAMKFGVIPIHQDYGILGQTPDIGDVIACVSREQFALSIKK
ncbi:cobalt-precorrin-5B (C(1))-methyltransferase [Butyrivibrio sp. INlla16]|uniref:cobalt-precorrin-5B (C(1))-methyltransferase n=1 Tax=Butyrivibrio sp. INlla16 TaxID=1520807 RepID=UPI00087F9313|nr:cobalt-precorrin-5B (C(1))-methyltransferase [Butyrivibrio sp. INlla16]SDB55618.1 cobalt-precorrin-5B (C1)-methyltransferase [Butyrivibrio sp. INlla16]